MTFWICPRSKAGRIELQLVYFFSRECVAQAVRTLMPVARQKELQLRDPIDSDVPERVTGDSNRVRQVLLNLVGYAIKFTGRGRSPFMS